MSRPRPVAWVREIVLTTGAIVGVACIVIALGAALFGIRPLVFQSGSMSPAIPTGALAIARDVQAADLRVGDVVMVETDRGARVTHRIVGLTQHDGRATLAMRGDANRTQDAQTYEVVTAPRVWFHLPVAGYVVAWLSGPIGLFVLGAYAMALILLLRPRRRTAERGRGGARKSTTSITAARSWSERVPLGSSSLKRRRSSLPGRTGRR